MILTNIKLVLEDTIIENGYIKINNDEIIDFGINNNYEGIDLNGVIVMPGFIDGHVHGAVGYDFMDASNEAYSSILSYLPQEGVTTVLATTMSQSLDVVKNVVQFISNYEQQPTNTKIAGIHLEGPFINKESVGAQNPNYIFNPNVDDFEYIRNKSDFIKIVTYAPELDEDLSFTNHLISLNIKGSFGHTKTTKCKCNKALNLGVNRVTHLYNAMLPFHHRELGLVNSAFFNKMLCELIVDKFHVHEDTVKTTFEILGSSNIVLITDSIRAKGLPDGKYDLGGQTVTVKGISATIDSGSIAGSTLNYNQAIKNMHEITNCDLIELSKMSSINQAKDLNLNTGIIKKGFKADLVILDSNLNVISTIINGKQIYQRG